MKLSATQVYLDIRLLYHVNLDFSISIFVIRPEQRAALRELITKPVKRT